MSPLVGLADARRLKALRDELIVALLASYEPDDQELAVLAVARAAGVAVHYEYRATFEASLAIDFTDAEWQLVAGELGNFDEQMSNLYGVSDAVGDWMQECVTGAGLDLRALEARKAERDAARGERA